MFNRFENKYLIDADTFYELTGALHSRMVPDVHNPVCPDKKDGKHEYAYYTISNIYYDTEDDYLIRQSPVSYTHLDVYKRQAYMILH